MLRAPAAAAAAAYAIAILIVFGDVLLGGGGRIVLSDARTDLANQFVSWRQFAFEQNLAHGHLPLWNPHLYGGAPFFAGAQSAMLYPVNWVHLLLPLGVALNLEIALNLWIAGMSMFAWTRHRRLDPAGCVFAGLVYMFCGPYWLHVFAGHLPHLAVMAWAPLVFLAIDGVIDAGRAGQEHRRDHDEGAQPPRGARSDPILGKSITPRGRSIALGICAVSMQLLAGHPQYVYDTAVIAGVYVLMNLALISGAGRRARTLGAALLIPAGAAMVTAIQLLPGLAAFGESLRARLSSELAGSFSFPPENLITLIAPGFFGEMTGQSPYWGKWYLWEASLFVGVVALALAILGAAAGRRRTRRFAVTMTLIALALALGSNTPLFALLYRFLPGFSGFRAPAKFGYLAALFLCMLGAIGFDGLITFARGAKTRIVFAAAVGTLAVVLLACGAAISGSADAPDGGVLARAMARIDWSQPGYGFRVFEPGRALFRSAAADAGVSLMWAGGIATAAALLILAASRRPKLAYGLLILGALELLVTARTFRATFDLPQVTQLIASIQTTATDRIGDARLSAFSPNLILSTGGYDIWGNDPMVLRRYAEFIAASQNADPEALLTAGQFQPSLMWRLLRAGYVLSEVDGRLELRDLGLPLLPHARLYGHAQVIGDSAARLRTLRDPAFDPQHTVILSRPPDPPPQPRGESGTARLTALSSDELDVEVEAPAPAVLLITDNFARGWRARELDLPAGWSYTIIPANHTHMAVALPTGHHHLRLEYRPAEFVVGAWISGISVLALAGIGAVKLARDRNGS